MQLSKGIMMITSRLEFIKMQGAGNDYIYIDCLKKIPDFDWNLLAQKFSDRHFGIGSDGLVLIMPSDKADCRMRMFNADGSESQMCGNALRCIAKYIFESGYVKNEELTIETVPGIVKAKVYNVDSKVESVSIELSKPDFHDNNLPIQAEKEPMIDYSLVINDIAYKISCVSVGNPHTILFVDELTDDLVTKVGPLIENHPMFPEKTNVEFVKVESRDKISVRVWERGSGETLACGSGACASGVISIYTKKTSDKLEIIMPGGELMVEWKCEKITLTGPASEVFRGSIKI
ncbi:diaminopimelate epimerase [bacterium]|nr:diaminopimelate epimerase [bacterium]